MVSTNALQKLENYKQIINNKKKIWDEEENDDIEMEQPFSVSNCQCPTCKGLVVCLMYGINGNHQHIKELWRMLLIICNYFQILKGIENIDIIIRMSCCNLPAKSYTCLTNEYKYRCSRTKND